MDFAIRPATPADIPAITRIYAHAVREGTASFELDEPDEAEMARRMASLLDGGFPYIAAQANGAVLGYAYAGPYRLRRRGIGRRLLDELITRSQACGHRQMIAVIGDSANTGSIELHRAAGFTMVGTFADVGFKFGRWLDSVLMQRAIGPGASTLP
jgi:L-amino acid N-acyltransferase YncA